MARTRPHPQSQTIQIRGNRLHYWDWPAGSSPARARLLFLHATGFHARTWDQVIRRLPASWHCLALDQRGHGRSHGPSDPDAYHWSEFVDDAAAFADALDLKGIVGVGHSMGGFVAAGAAAKTQRDFRFLALALVDPVIIDDQDPARRRPLPRRGGRRGMQGAAGDRRPSWPSAGAMYAAYQDRPPFDSWEPAALRDYCDHALQPDGPVDALPLACPPALEAATFERTRETNPWPGLARLAIPVAVLRGTDPDATLPSATDPKVASATPQGYDVPIAGAGHFIPMERPDRVADEIGRLTRKLGLPA